MITVGKTKHEFHWHYCRVKIEELFDAAAWFDAGCPKDFRGFSCGWRVTPGDEIHIED
jgi:hypothetical protein